MPPGPGQPIISIPIPAAVSKVFAACVLIMGSELTSFGGSCLQEVWPSIQRDALGALLVSSGETNGTLRLGSGSNNPLFSGLTISGNDLVLNFDNPQASPIAVNFVWTLSPALTTI